MREKLAILVLTVLGRTPLGFNRWLGSQIGRIAWHRSKRDRHVALTNLKLCFPDRSNEWHHKIGLLSFQNMAKTLLEAPVLWKMDCKRILSLCDNFETFEAISKDYNRGKGLIIATPHLGSWEYGGLLFACIHPLTNLFKPPRMKGIEKIMTRGRSSTGARLAPTDASGIKALARALRVGEAIGLLPDQEATADNGVFAPFFDIPAYTMSLLPKLAQRRNSPVYFFFIERLDGNRGYRVHHRKAGSDIYSKDIATACAAMNHEAEAVIRLCPQQYNWAYKRFDITDDGKQLY